MIYKLLYVLIWPIMWFVFPLTRRVRVLIFNEKNQILLVKHKIGMGKWSLAGGGIKLNETIIAAAIREIKEELSISIKNPEILNKDLKIINVGGIMYRLNYVYAKSENAEIKPNWEISDYKWFYINEIDSNTNDIKAGLRLLNKSSIDVKTD